MKKAVILFMNHGCRYNLLVFNTLFGLVDAHLVE